MINLHVIGQEHPRHKSYVWHIDEPLVDAEKQITAAIMERFSAGSHIGSIRVGSRDDDGPYTYYVTTFLMAGRQLGFGGEEEYEFRFNRDMIDAAMRSAGL